MAANNSARHEITAASRQQWDVGGTPSLEAIQTGCLQRIAAALEKLVELHDPESRNKAQARAEANARVKRSEDWYWRVCKPAERILRKRFYDWLAPAAPTPKEKTDMQNFFREAFHSLRREHIGIFRSTDRHPTDDDTALAGQFVSSVGPRALFDAARDGVIKRRLAAVVARLPQV